MFEPRSGEWVATVDGFPRADEGTGACARESVPRDAQCW